MSVKIAAFIPARGGSKRLPGKNIRHFNGKPLIEWSIRFAIRSKVFHTVLVSTDDDEIAAVSIQAGAVVIRRPPELSADESPTVSAATHAFRTSEVIQQADFICTLQPTNPLRPAGLMERIVADSLLPTEGNSLMTVSKCELKMGKLAVDGKYKPINYSFGQRSQDMDHLFYENGLLYVTPAKLISEGRLFGDEVFTFVTDKKYSVDIDDLVDFQIGEMLFQQNKELNYLL